MAKKPTKMQCRILYRHCEFEGVTPNDTLQNLLRQALEHQIDGVEVAKSWRLRLRDLSVGVDVSEFNFINHVRGLSHQNTDNLFGDLCRYEAGAQQAIIDQVDGAAELQVNLLSPEERQEFLDGMLWWRISGNHVLAVQGTKVRWRVLESYLNWLLKERTTVIGKKTSLILTRTTKANATSRSKAAVQSVMLSGSVFRPAERTEDSEEEEELETFEDSRSVPTAPIALGGLRRLLEAVMPDNRKLQKLVDAIPDDAPIKLEMKIVFPGKRAMPNRITLSSVEHALDALEDAEVTVQTDQGKIRLGDMLQQPEHFARVLSHGGIWDREDVYIALGEAWRTLKSKGLIVEK